MTIGVFDSGIGGLTVLKHLVRVLPEYDMLYLGDNARAPYGDRSADRIYEFTQQAVAHLFEEGCALVILACNTASSEALRRLQQEFLPSHFPDRRILGILIPAAELIEKKYAQKNIGIIGTRATVQSNAYLREIEKRGMAQKKVTQIPCPLLVPLIEEGWQDTPPGRQILKKYLYPLKQKQVDVLVLGCTHYALIKDRVARIMGKKVAVIDTGSAAAASLKKYLSCHPEIEKTLSKNSAVRLLSTDTSERICSLVQRYWGSALPIEQITLE
ncbi:glutamate racemase [Candidatus Uhrbacteria bacterium]|nr:glutamate racemase [Candidatus Uhrbacteria bacterium]